MIRNVSIAELQTAMADGARVIDVREAYEVATGRVPGAEHIPMALIPLRMDELRDGDVYVICEVGGRSAQVVAFLARQGIDAANVEGGMVQWRGSGLPVETGV